MKYIKVTFSIKPFSEDLSDILAALLCDVGFEAFEASGQGTEAYIQKSLWDESQVKNVIDGFPVDGVYISYVAEDAADEDWNRKWEEEGFEPIVIGNQIAVHDKHHTDIPAVEHDILISPKQAFGTGSHQTTRMILKQLCKMNLKDKRIVDAGTGTGILSILCAKRGAEHILAYDIDEWSVENTRYNLALNGIEPDKVVVIEGDASVLKEMGKDADIVIANINRNILLEDMPHFHRVMKEGGCLLVSGFYTDDIPLLEKKAETLGLKLEEQFSDDGWAMLLFCDGNKQLTN